MSHETNFQIPGEIETAVRNNHLISQRVNELRQKGYNIQECPMGTGGVLQVRQLKSETRIQIGYGHGKHNYAMCVIL